MYKRQGLGHLAADGSPADDGEAFGHLLKLEEVGVGEDVGDVPEAGDGRNEGLRADGDEDLFRTVVLAAGADGAVVDELGLALDQVCLLYTSFPACEGPHKQLPRDHTLTDPWEKRSNLCLFYLFGLLLPWLCFQPFLSLLL